MLLLFKSCSTEWAEWDQIVRYILWQVIEVHKLDKAPNVNVSLMAAVSRRLMWMLG